MTFEFAKISTEKRNENILAENFDEIEYGSNERYFLSKKMYLQDEEDGVHKFPYKYMIHVVDWAEYGDDMNAMSVELLFIPFSKHLAEGMKAEYGKDEDYKPEESSYYLDACGEGYYIIFGHEDLEYTEDTKIEMWEKANDLAITAGDVTDSVNSLRGFYLDAYVNRIGNTGWDMINDWVYNEISFTDAAFKRYEEEKAKRNE